jgi:hypothetical protein
VPLIVLDGKVPHTGLLEEILRIFFYLLVSRCAFAIPKYTECRYNIRSFCRPLIIIWDDNQRTKTVLILIKERKGLTRFLHGAILGICKPSGITMVMRSLPFLMLGTICNVQSHH